MATTSQEQRVSKDFWPKLKKSLASVPFAEEVVAAYYCAFDPATPLKVKGILLGALAYFIMPLDGRKRQDNHRPAERQPRLETAIETKIFAERRADENHERGARILPHAAAGQMQSRCKAFLVNRAERNAEGSHYAQKSSERRN